MKDQVTSIEQSKRLIELGVPAEKASMVYRKTNILGIVRLEVKKGKGGVVAPAFTVADLLELLPSMIFIGISLILSWKRPGRMDGILSSAKFYRTRNMVSPTIKALSTFSSAVLSGWCLTDMV